MNGCEELNTDQKPGKREVLASKHFENTINGNYLIMKNL